MLHLSWWKFLKNLFIQHQVTNKNQPKILWKQILHDQISADLGKLGLYYMPHSFKINSFMKKLYL